ncbi:MAG: hypothetical protein WBN40_02745 [Pseudomonadales bacterium]
MSQQPPERRFDILFQGEAINGTDVSEVKENLRSLFKLGEAELVRMFSGQPISIKKDLDRKTANQYQQALARAGAKIQLVLHQSARSPGDTPDEKTADVAGTGGITLLPAGSRLGPEHGNAPPPVDIDTSHISIADETAAAGGTAVFAIADPFAEGATAAADKGPRYPLPDHIELDTGLSLAELGNLLERAEALPPLNVDTDHLSIAELGATLGTGERAAAAEPVISADLSLAEAGSELLQAHEKRVLENIEVDTSSLSLSEN